MLDRGEPPALHGLGDGRCCDLLEIELLFLRAVVEHGACERVRVDGRVRALGWVMHANHLRVGRTAPAATGRRLDRQREVDTVLATTERVDLASAYGSLAYPVEAHDELILAVGECVVVARGAERASVIRLRAPGCTSKTRLKYPELRRRIVQEANDRVGCLLVDRISRKVRSYEIAAVRIDQHVEHVGAHVNQLAPLDRGGLLGRRGYACIFGVETRQGLLRTVCGGLGRVQRRAGGRGVVLNPSRVREVAHGEHRQPQEQADVIHSLPPLRRYGAERSVVPDLRPGSVYPRRRRRVSRARRNPTPEGCVADGRLRALAA